MARASVLGNGNTLCGLDSFGQIRDFYFPYAGQENHIGQNQLHKIGVFVDGRMSWLGESEWQSRTEYVGRSMVAKTLTTNSVLQITLEIDSIIYNEKDIFLRKVLVKNQAPQAREIKIFFNQQFKIGDTNHADTAYFSSTIESIIHYKGRRVFLVGGLCDNRTFDDYSIGFCGIEGKEGTWRDAEDGVLSKNPIEHGIVDSVIGWGRVVAPGASMTIFQWIAVGQTYREAVELLSYIFEKTPEHLLESTQDFWQAWTGQVELDQKFFPPEISKLFYASLLVMRAHSDNRGGILASSDSGNVQYGGDTYTYVWPRDACFTALAFDQAGFFDLSRRFYDFASKVLTEEGYVLHKYQPDRSLGSSWHPWVKDGKRQLAIQEDETAILLVGLWEHYIRAKDLEFIESLYNGFIKRSAEFLMRYRDQKTGLPLSSYDLWEERYGISPFTTSLISAALASAGRFAKTLGKDEESRLFFAEAENVRTALLRELWNEEEKYFEEIVEKDGVMTKQKRLDMSAFYASFRFGIFAPDDPRLIQNFDLVKQKLSSGLKIGGLARYEGDLYCKSVSSAVGNPWFVTSLWALQYEVLRAGSISDLLKIVENLKWVARFAYFDMLSEQLDPETGQPLSATPLVWSHSEFVRTILEIQKKKEALAG